MKLGTEVRYRSPAGKICKAFITALNNDRTVDLQVYTDGDPDGPVIASGARSVSGVARDDSAELPNTWHEAGSVARARAAQIRAERAAKVDAEAKAKADAEAKAKADAEAKAKAGSKT